VWDCAFPDGHWLQLSGTLARFEEVAE